MKRRRVLWAILATIPIAIAVVGVTMPYRVKQALDVYQEDGFVEVYSRALRRTQGHFRRCPLMVVCPVDEPVLRWETTTPEAVGLSGERLETLGASLSEQGTTSLLVVRDGKIAFEWYDYGYGPNDLHNVAAAAKGITGSTILLALLTDNRLKLDQRVADFISRWKHDSQKSRITFEQLASHSSGMDDVEFSQSHSGWKDIYLQNDDQRFRLALDQAPILFEPGSGGSYSGVGYYVLAYAFGTVLEGFEEPTDLNSFLETRIMERLDIAATEWRLGYGRAYEIDGMTLYTIGSGVSFTARSAARIGQLFIQDGVWDGQQILDATWVERALTYSGSSPFGASGPPAGLGWWVNSQGFFASLPEDAAVSMGNGAIVLIVPSLSLVAVRFGGPLGDDMWQSAEQELFEPLMAAVTSDH